MSRNIQWTPEEDARLVELRQSGMKNQELADALGRTVNAVNLRLCYLKRKAELQLKKNATQTPEEDLQLPDLPEEEYTPEEMAAATRSNAKEKAAACAPTHTTAAGSPAKNDLPIEYHKNANLSMLDDIELMAAPLYTLADLAIDLSADTNPNKRDAVLCSILDKARELKNAISEIIHKGGLPDAVHS